MTVLTSVRRVLMSIWFEVPATVEPAFCSHCASVAPSLKLVSTVPTPVGIWASGDMVQFATDPNCAS